MKCSQFSYYHLIFIILFSSLITCGSGGGSGEGNDNSGTLTFNSEYTIAEGETQITVLEFTNTNETDIYDISFDSELYTITFNYDSQEAYWNFVNTTEYNTTCGEDNICEVQVTVNDGSEINIYDVAITIESSQIEKAFTINTNITTGNGSISPMTTRVNYGDNETFSIIPDVGYEIDTVSGCSGTLNGFTYTTSSITADCVVNVSFVADHRTAGCGNTDVITGIQRTLSINVNNVEYNYDLYIPSAYNPEQPYALVFGFHGLNQTANTHQFNLNQLSMAHNDFSINVAPQGFGENKSFASTINLLKSIALTESLIEHLTATYCINSNHIFAVGFSNGGQFAFHLAAYLGDQFASIVPFSGRCLTTYPSTSSCSFSTEYEFSNDGPPRFIDYNYVGHTNLLSVMGENDTTRLSDEAAARATFQRDYECDDSTTTFSLADVDCELYQNCQMGSVSFCRVPNLVHQIWQQGMDAIYAGWVAE